MDEQTGTQDGLDTGEKLCEARMPIPNGTNGRDERGRFAKGNPGGPGNPLARRAQELRTAAMGAVTADDMRGVIRRLVDMAKEGDVQAARLVLERTLGKVTAPAGIDGETEFVVVATTSACVVQPPKPRLNLSALTDGELRTLSELQKKASHGEHGGAL